MDALEHFAPNAWGALPHEYKDGCERDFEQGMVQISNRLSSHALPPLQRAMAAYFFSFMPQITNLYLRLANRIKMSNWNLKGSLVTFNYERLLPLSLSINGLKPIIGNEPTANQIGICLPHGICNLFCISVQAFGDVSFSGFNVGFDGELRFVENPLDFDHRILTNKIPPVMCYFEPQKRTSAGYSFIMNERKRYNELVLRASKIALVGFKVRPHDVHVWEPLAQTNAELVYCSGVESCKEFLNWTKTTRPDKASRVLEGYFNEQFENICSEVEL